MILNLNNIIFLNSNYPIGYGNFSLVYKVQLKHTNKIYALKVIDTSKLNNIDKDSLYKEIKIHKSINHKNIVKFFEFFIKENNYYILLEYCEYGSLYYFINESKGIPKKLAWKIFINVSNAIYYLHKNKIIHRDIKPENILLDKNLNIKLCDFGLSKYNNDTEYNICGTYEYMSPELLFNKYYNYKIDMWSLGILLYQLINGKLPYEYTDDFTLETWEKSLDFNNSNMNSNVKFLLNLLLEMDYNRRINIFQLKNINFLNCINLEYDNDDINYFNNYLKKPFKLTKNKIVGNYYKNGKIIYIYDDYEITL